MRPLKKPSRDRPGRVRVLIDIDGRAQGRSTATALQEDAQRDSGSRLHAHDYLVLAQFLGRVLESRMRRNRLLTHAAPDAPRG